MPNGGHPLHMVLKPKNGKTVIYCRGPEMRIVTSDNWEADGVNADPVAILDSRECAALAGFLKHWLHKDLRNVSQPDPDVDAEYDF